MLDQWVLGVWRCVTCRVKSIIRLSPVLQLWLLHARWPESQVLSERHERQKLHAASSGFWRWRSKRRGGGLLWQHPCWWRGCREWEGNLYNYNHFIFWGGGLREWEEDGAGGGGGGVGGQAPLDVCGCTLPCCSLRKIDSTPFNTKAIIQFMWHWEWGGGHFCVSSTSHVSSDWQQLQCFMESLPLSKRVVKGFFFFFLSCWFLRHKLNTEMMTYIMKSCQKMSSLLMTAIFSSFCTSTRFMKSSWNKQISWTDMMTRNYPVV